MDRIDQFLFIITASLLLVLGGAVAINSPQATIFTVAGTGTSGYSGDGDPGIIAELNYPYATKIGLPVDEGYPSLTVAQLESRCFTRAQN